MAKEMSMRQELCITTLFASCIWLTACVTSPSIGEEDIVRLAIKEASVVMKVSGDADGDGDDDVLLIIDRERIDGSRPRGLLIFLRGPDGSLTEALDSPHAILCRACGGMMGDPLESLSAAKGELKLRFEGGSRELWSSEYSFDYMPGNKQWRLVSIVHHGLDRLEGRSVERQQDLSRADTVFLERFDPADYPADAIP
ncbi:hypothetical protein [Pseudoxanthomonas japonensis]|uniref:hypothetical protein n=1 Tax=Pseudoxanthomonas japonensis TaxID=69284 RepID=UPI003748B976